MRIYTHSKILQIAEWPEIDQKLWAAGLESRNWFDGLSYADSLRPITLCNAARGYGRWLAVLASRGALDASVPPAERVTPANAQVYLQALSQAENNNNTIHTRFFDLRCALHVLQPEVDTTWLTKPDGRSLRVRLPIKRQLFFVPESLELYQWGFDVMAAALRHDSPVRRCTLYRNGLLIALLAARAPRIRSLTAMRLHQHLQPNGDEFRLVFEVEDVKGEARPIEYELPRGLIAPMRHYLDVVRPVLMGTRTHAWLWVGQLGEPMGFEGVGQMIRRASLARFRVEFGTHRFRHAMGTSAPIADPANPTAIAAVLGNSAAVMAKNYNRGRRKIAAQQAQSTLQRQRDESRILADSLFRRR